jgi:hypothetical protein
MENDEKWLKTIKKGDPVFFETNYLSKETLTPDTVKKVTKTMILLEKTTTRFKRNGRVIGGSTWYGGTYLHPNSPEMQKRYYMYIHKINYTYLLGVLQSTAVVESITHDQFNRINPMLIAIRDELIPKKVKQECLT